MLAALSSLAQNLFRIRPDELRRTLLAFTYLFASVGSFVIGRIARSVLFLEIPNYKEQLPLTYMGVAATVSLVMYGYARVERKLRRDKTNFITLIILVGVTVAFRLALMRPSHGVYWAFFIWTEVYGTILIVQFWSIVNEIFHSRQAKRLFAFIGGGGVLSSIVVGFGVRSIVADLGTENLLLVIAALLSFAVYVVSRLGAAARSELTAALERAPQSTSRSKAVARASHKAFATRHVQFIAAVVVLTYFVSTLVDYQFNVIIADSITGKDARSEYFGLFFGVTGAIGGFVQFFLTARLLEKFGVLFCLLLLPCCMFLGSMGIAAAPMVALLSSLFTVAFTKGSEAVLRYTVNDSTLQLLYLPVPAQVRGRAKAFIDGILKPLSIGGAAAVLAILMGQFEKLTGYSLGFEVTVFQLSWIVGVALFGWVGALLALRREYLKSLVQTLHRRRLNFADATYQIGDEATVRTLGAALTSARVGDVLNALELLKFVSPKQRQGLGEAVVDLLEHESEDIRMAALGYLRGGEALQDDEALHGDEVALLLDDPSAPVRSAAALAYCAMLGDRALQRTEPLLRDRDLKVRSSAIAGLVRHGGLDGVLACADVLKSMLKSPDENERCQAAWILGEVSLQNFYQPLIPLLQDEADTVRLAAVSAAGKLKSAPLVDSLLEQFERPTVAAAAVQALAQYGSGLEKTLEGILSDSTTSTAKRVHVCKLLARLNTGRAIDILSGHLEDEQVHVRSAAVQALRVAVNHVPNAKIDRNRLLVAIRDEAQAWYQLLALDLDLKLVDNDSPLLSDAIHHRQALAQERILGLLSIAYPDQPIELVSSNLQSKQTSVRGNAVEVLDNLLDKDEKAYLIPIFDDGPAERKAEVGADLFAAKRTSRNARLAELLTSPDAWLRVCAASAVGEWKVEEHIEKVASLLAHDDAVVRETALGVLSRLEAGEAFSEHANELTDDPNERISRYARFLLGAATPTAAAT